MALFAIGMLGCTLPKQPISAGHIQERPTPPSKPPPLVKILTPPPISADDRKRIETYSVVVKDVDIKDLLFSLARDAKVDVDISPDVTGYVTLNAVKQTLPQILSRLSAIFDMTYEKTDGVYRISKDKPVLRSYRVEYPNIVRTSKSETKLNALDSGTDTGESSTEITTSSTNDFWKTLTENIKDILRDTDKEVTLKKIRSLRSNKSNATATNQSPIFSSESSTNLEAGNDTEIETEEIQKLYAANVIVNPESGILQVRATNRQQAKIKEFLDLVLSSSRRQVLIEATIVEVQLSQQYEQGIDWSIVRNIAANQSGLLGFGSALSNTANTLINSGASNLPFPINTNANGLELAYANTSGNTSFLSSIRLLEAFGNVKVLSSPKVSVLNNQTALLKITDNIVYFTTAATTIVSANGIATGFTYTTTPNVVPVGFVMSVTPFIGSDGSVQLNLRPSITRVLSYIADPNPALSNAGVESNIPITRSREIESIMRVSDGNIAVLGGLMEDYSSGDLAGLPGLTRSAVGGFLANKSGNRIRTELVIFIRPRIIKNADLSADYSDFQHYMLNNDSFQEPHPAIK